MNTILFSCTSLQGTSKAGILPKDENGYRTMAIGGLKVYNSSGIFYTAEGAKELFEESSQLQRRIKRGCLRGEMGHPKQDNYKSMDSYMQRILSIEETNVCAHFAEIWLDFDSYTGPDGPIVSIMAKVTPSGPKADALERAFSNPKENVCFSIRALSKDNYYGGKTIRTLKNVVTFDYVNEPGISIAEKYKSPALEQYSEMLLTEQHFDRMLSNTTAQVALESNLLTRDGLFKSFGWEAIEKQKPAYMSW